MLQLVTAPRFAMLQLHRLSHADALRRHHNEWLRCTGREAEIQPACRSRRGRAVSQRSKRQTIDAATQVALATVTTTAGVAVGGPAGAVLGAAATPGLSAGVRMLSEKVARKRLERSSEIMHVTAQSLGVGEEELAEVLISDERVLELAGRIILSAQDISLASKRRALAAALATAISDPSPARLDMMELIHAAIAEIDAPHIRFLQLMTDVEALPKLPDRPISGRSYGIDLVGVLERDPGLSEGGLAVQQKLISLGLLENARNGLAWGADGSYALSPLGRRLLSFLEESRT